MASEASRVRGRTARECEVRRVLAAGERDGLTQRATAARAGMPAGTLAWWRSEIRRRDEVRAKGEERPVFLEVVAAPDGGEMNVGGGADTQPVGETPRHARGDGEAFAAFEVELRGGRRLRVPASFGLARLVREIESC